MSETPVQDNLEEFLKRSGVFQEKDLTQEEIDAIIRFYYAHGLDRLDSLQEFFKQMT